MTRYSILQAVISPRTDERINIGILMTDGVRTLWQASEQKLGILRYARGEAAYRMVKRICDGLQSDEQLRQDLMQPSQLAYLGRYSNNLLTLTNASTYNATLTTATGDMLYHHAIG